MRHPLLPVLVLFVPIALACGGKLDELKAQGDAAKAEGAAWAVGRDQAACVTEALARSAKESDTAITYHALNGVWLQTCLGAATPTPGLCDGVPSTDAITETVTWRLAYCEARGRGQDQSCQRLLSSIQDHCHPT